MKTIDWLYTYTFCLGGSSPRYPHYSLFSLSLSLNVCVYSLFSLFWIYERVTIVSRNFPIVWVDER